eukprot:1817649-Prymnesium_polylepis.1
MWRAAGMRTAGPPGDRARGACADWGTTHVRVTSQCALHQGAIAGLRDLKCKNCFEIHCISRMVF